MTLKEYNRLNEKQRSFVLRKYGVNVGYALNKYYEFHLFQVSSFYIEVISRVDGTPCGSRSFDSILQLDRYLNRIDISLLIA